MYIYIYILFTMNGKQNFVYNKLELLNFIFFLFLFCQKKTFLQKIENYIFDNKG